MASKKKPAPGIVLELGAEPDHDDEDRDEDEQDLDEVKKSAAEAMLEAFKRDDAAALMDAMDTFVDASCEARDQPEPEDEDDEGYEGEGDEA